MASSFANFSTNRPPVTTTYLLLLLLTITFLPSIHAFSTPNPSSNTINTTPKSQPKPQPYSNVLIMDHININHQKSRHDLLKTFYFTFLSLSIDPRKAKNIKSGRKTLWANIGAHQFHLPEGKPHAQVLDGVITLLYPDVGELVRRYEEDLEVRDVLLGEDGSNSLFRVERKGGDEDRNDGNDKNDELSIIDPWGTHFKVIQPPPPSSSTKSHEEYRDERGLQKGGDTSLGLSLTDITLYTPKNANLSGIARFYRTIFDAPILKCDETICVVSMGPYQTLSFVPHPEGKGIVSHEDLRCEEEEEDVNKEGREIFPSNYGPHISIYVRDIRSTYRRAEKLGVTYVNPRFSRRAYDEEGAVDDCMFRVLDIVDPEDGGGGDVIMRIEHEVRSVVERDGGLYKSCPFDEVPEGCTV